MRRRRQPRARRASTDNRQVAFPRVRLGREAKCRCESLMRRINQHRASASKRRVSGARLRRRPRFRESGEPRPTPVRRDRRAAPTGREGHGAHSPAAPNPTCAISTGALCDASQWRESRSPVGRAIAYAGPTEQRCRTPPARCAWQRRLGERCSTHRAPRAPRAARAGEGRAAPLGTCRLRSDRCQR